MYHVTFQTRQSGCYSEQAVEAIHATFATLWQSFLVKDDDSDVYLVNGLKAILKFNADQTNSQFDPSLAMEEQTIKQQKAKKTIDTVVNELNFKLEKWITYYVYLKKTMN